MFRKMLVEVSPNRHFPWLNLTSIRCAMRCRERKLQWRPSRPKSSKRQSQKAAEKRYPCSLVSVNETQILISFRMCMQCTRLHQFCQLWETMETHQGRQSWLQVLQSFRSTRSLCCLYSPMNWTNEKCSINNYLKLSKLLHYGIRNRCIQQLSQSVG